jgi:integrase
MATSLASKVVAMPAVKGVRPRQPRRGRIALAPDELLGLLKAAKQRSIRDWAMILIGYRHGLRASEICSLSFDDLDLKNGLISVQRLKGSLKTVQPLMKHPGQPLLDELAALRAWLRIRPNDGSNFVFVSREGGRLDRSQFFRNFQASAEAAGLPPEKRHPHCLKHALGTHLVAGNVNLALVKQALGHRSIGSTMVYAGTTDGQAADAVRSALMGIF